MSISDWRKKYAVATESEYPRIPQSISEWRKKHVPQSENVLTEPALIEKTNPDYQVSLKDAMSRKPAFDKPTVTTQIQGMPEQKQPIKMPVVEEMINPEEKPSWGDTLYQSLFSGMLESGKQLAGVGKLPTQLINAGREIGQKYAQRMATRWDPAKSIGQIVAKKPEIEPIETEQTRNINQILEGAEQIQGLINEKLEKGTPAQKYLGKIIQSLPPVVSAQLLGSGYGNGLSAFMTLAGSSYAREAELEGATPAQQLVYGGIMGLIEGGTEHLTLGKTIDTIFQQGGKPALMAWLKSIPENALQEVAADVASALTKRATYQPEAELPTVKQLGESAALGAGTAGLLGAGAMVPGNIGRQVTEQVQSQPTQLSQQTITPQDTIDQLSENPEGLDWQQKKKTDFDTPEIVKAREEQSQIKSTHEINTPERQTLRQQITDELYGTGAKNKNKQVYLIMGLPASGKSTISDPIVSETGSLLIDSDLAKEKLPEFQGGKFAGAVHIESSDIADNILSKALDGGDNIVLPVVGKSVDKMRRLINSLKNEGYSVHLRLMDISPETAAQRAIQRWKDTGRFVDPDYIINQVGLHPKENYGILKSEGGLDSYEAYSNDVERGQKPKLIESSFRAKVSERDRGRLLGGQLDQDVGETSTGKTAESKLEPSQNKEAVSSSQKEPWQMSLLEYGKSRLPQSQASQVTDARQVASFSGQHIKDIKAALSRGEEVPVDILREYRGTEWADNALRKYKTDLVKSGESDIISSNEVKEPVDVGQGDSIRETATKREATENIFPNNQGIDSTRKNKSTLKSQPLIEKAGFSNAEEAHIAIEAKKNGRTWFKKEFSDLNDDAYNDLTSKLDRLSEEEQDSLKFDLQFFAMREPDFTKNAKIKVREGYLVSRFRKNTLQKTSSLGADVKKRLTPEEFDYLPETSEEWQNKAMANIERDREKVIQDIVNTQSLSGGTQAHEAAIITLQLVDEAKKTGDYEPLKAWTKLVAEKTRETARALKGTDTAWEKTKSVEGAIAKAQRVITNAQDATDNLEPTKKRRVSQQVNRVKVIVNKAKKDAAEILAQRIATTVNKKKAKQNDPIRDMIEELFRVAKESPLPKHKTNARDPYEFLSQAIQNKEKYSEVWANAKKNVVQKYSKDANALKLLNDYIGNPADPTYSQATLSKAINLSLKDLSLKIQDVAKSSMENQQKALDDLQNYLIGSTGISQEDATALSEQVKKEFDKLVADKASDTLKSIFREKAESHQNNDKIKPLIELANLGAFKNDTYMNKIGSKITPVLRKLLNESKINLGSLVRKSVSDVEFTRDMFLLELETKLKIDRSDASVILKETEKVFNDLVAQKKKTILASMFNGKPTTKTRKSLTEKIVELINLGAYDDARITDLIKEKEGYPVLNDDDVEFIVETMEKARSAQDGSREQQIELAKVKERIVSKLPVSLGEKISAFQTIAQLLNPKTLIRNVGGNIVFGVEQVSGLIGAGVDKAVSLYTKKRTKLAPNLQEEYKGLVRGVREAWQDYKLGIDTSPSLTQFDLPRKQAFKKGVMKEMERALNLGLKLGDRPFYQAAYEGALAEQMKLGNVAEPTKEMIDFAHEVARYRTFQDENAISNLFSRIKHLLNFKKGKLAGFGFGDLILKYPKTPANLIARAIDYSPAGFINSLNQLYKGTKGEFNQRKFVDSVSRATVGTGMFLAGMALFNLGIISGRPDEDKDVNALEQAIGRGAYKINLSALKRFLLTFDPKAAELQTGDKLLSYDWIQPAAVSVSAGVNVAQQFAVKRRIKALDVFGAITTSIEGGFSTLAEQPLISGLTRMFRGYNSDNIVDNLLAIAMSAPASFIPTLFSQIRQIVDNTKRNVQGENQFDTGVNLVKNKIPGLSGTLPNRVNTLGEIQRMYQNNNAFNVFLNPAFTSEFKNNEAAKLVLDIYNRTGVKEHFPRVAPKYITYLGKKVKLTPKQQNELQTIMGQEVSKRFTALAQNKAFLARSDESKIDIMKDILDDVSRKARMAYIKNHKEELKKAAN